MLRILAVLSLVLALAFPALAADVPAAAPAENGILKEGDVIPDNLMTKDLDGKEVSLKSQLKMPFTFIQFMTTACSACQGEAAILGKMGEKFKKSEIIAVAGDINGRAAVEAYEAKAKSGNRYVLDSDFKLAPRFGFTYTPSFVMVDKSGKVLVSKGGFMASKFADTEKRLSDILSK